MKFTVRMAKGGFFDRESVMRAADKATIRNLNAAGRLIRAYAQKSLIYSERISPAGRPPFVHKTGTKTRKSRSTGKTRVRRVSFLREYLFYAYDHAAGSVVVGPALLNSTASRGALHALEHGGKSSTVDKGKPKIVNVRARPFMGPALKAKAPELPSLWKDSIR